MKNSIHEVVVGEIVDRGLRKQREKSMTDLCSSLEDHDPCHVHF